MNRAARARRRHAREQETFERQRKRGDERNERRCEFTARLRGTLIRGAKLATALRRAASCPPPVRDAINAKLWPFCVRANGRLVDVLEEIHASDIAVYSIADPLLKVLLETGRIDAEEWAVLRALVAQLVANSPGWLRYRFRHSSRAHERGIGPPASADPPSRPRGHRLRVGSAQQ